MRGVALLVPLSLICYNLLRSTSLSQKRSRRKETYMPYQRSPGSSSSAPVVVVRRRSPRSTKKTLHSPTPTTQKTTIFSPGSSLSSPSGPAAVGRVSSQAVPREEALALLAILLERWPHAFPSQAAEVHPLALNIDQEIASQLEGWSAKQARRAIAFWKRPRTVTYLRALAAGGPRYDLAGTPQGAITPEEQQHAAQQLAARSTRRQAKKQVEQ